MLNTALGRFRIISLLDGISFIYLLYCSIYLKRMMDQPEAIRIPGLVHGIIFTIYCILLLQLMLNKNWSMKRIVLIGLTSLIPFAPFFLEIWLKKQEQAEQ